MHVRLETEDGRDVADLEIPEFRKPPDVLLWGVRVFQWTPLPGRVLCYRECFAYAIPIMEEKGDVK